MYISIYIYIRMIIKYTYTYIYCHVHCLFMLGRYFNLCPQSTPIYKECVFADNA